MKQLIFKKINRVLFNRTIYLILLSGLFLCCNVNLSAQSKDVKKAPQKKEQKKKEQHFEAEVSFASIYDNNILKYSDKYLDRFMNGLDEGRFHIKTYDDIILYGAADLSATYRIIKKLKSKFNISFFSNSYMTNNIKNWYFVSAGYQQYFTKKASFKIFYNYIPHYYVRHFRDEDWVAVYGYTPETFVQFAYSKENYGFWIQNTFLKNTRINASFDFSKYYHNKHYTEYDCKNYIVGLSLYQPVYKTVRLEFGYEHEYSDAKGYDQPGETKATADDADATYFENGFIFGVNWELPEIRKKENILDVKAAYQKRYYLSEHYLEEDREHTGRVDDNIQLSAIYSFYLTKELKLAAFYRYYMRNSNSDSPVNQLYLSAEKDYKQSQVGLQVTYNIKF
jgi:hypothetical protein